MKYFYDCEFLEGTQTKRFLGIPYGNTKPTIDLISIGIVAEDGRELYLISKEFNLREAWDRHDIKVEYRSGDARNHLGDTYLVKDYWIRENVLKPIWAELMEKEIGVETPKEAEGLLIFEWANLSDKIKYLEVKRLINKYGYTNAEIAEKVKEFCTNDPLSIKKAKYYNVQHNPIELYGYYSAYDHVVLCWLFGKMIDLPKGFPMYTIDLKQTIAFFESNIAKRKEIKAIEYNSIWNKIDKYEDHVLYPKKTNEHNALSDARWNKELHNFIKSL
jgi:hypothetical protein